MLSNKLSIVVTQVGVVYHNNSLMKFLHIELIAIIDYLGTLTPDSVHALIIKQLTKLKLIWTSQRS